MLFGAITSFPTLPPYADMSKIWEQERADLQRKRDLIDAKIAYYRAKATEGEK
jgi:hypothetical protein